MNPVARLTRYANAWTQFRKIQRPTLDSCSLEEIMDEVFRYANGFFALVQQREEFLGALQLVRADSHQPETLELTRKYLEGDAVDFLFIDADHTEAGVRADYKMYSPLVKKGGIILFHDIAINNPEYGLKKLWAELAPQHKHHEFLGKPKPWGLGLLYH